MAKRITGSTPKLDGYRMPAEFEPQAGVWMLWPARRRQARAESLSGRGHGHFAV